nr:hypothetical protein [Tanacetum cinerariifolium]
MTSFGYRSNPRYAIKECSACGTLYTRDCGCSKGNVKDKILVPKPPKNYAQCTRCGYLVDGPNCQGCALLRQELEENLDHRSFVDKIIFDLNRAPDSPNQFHCFHCKDVLRDGEACKRCTCVKCGSGLGKGLCYICGHNQNSLNCSPNGIFCKRCTCKSCGKDAHIGYNYPSKGPVISNPEPCNNQTIDEFPQTLPSFHPTFHSEAESPFNLDSTPTYVDESLNVFNPPPQSPVYPCEFCGNDAYYGYYCTPQAPFIYPEPCYNHDFNFPKIFKMFHNNILVVMIVGLLIMRTNDNSLPLDVSNDQIEDFFESNNAVSSIDDDSFSIDNIDYVEASPLDSELVSSKTKSSSTSLNSLLEETNTFDNSLPEFETFCFDDEEISSGSTTTHPDISLPEYEVFYDDHVKEISSGSPTTHSYSSHYALFIFDLSINLFHPADRSDFYEFTDELIPFISAPEYDCFLFKVEPNSRDFTKDVVEDISPIKEPQVLNTLPTL